MTCTIALSALTPVMSGGQLVSISLQGSVQFSGGDHCSSLDISVSCGPVGVTQNVPLYLWTPTSGSFTAQFPNLPPGITNCCGHDVTVTISCPACGTHTYLLPLNCSSKCPDLAGITCTVGPCQYDGMVQLSCNAQVAALNGFTSGFTVQWEINGSPVGSPIAVTAPGWVPAVFTVPGAGQTITLSLVVVIPGVSCPPIGMTVTLPACGQGCSPIQIDSHVGECNKDGTRPVTITAVLTGGTATTQISATMTSPCGTVNGSNAGSLTLTNSCNLGPGTYTVTVTAVGCHAQTYTFTVPACCPKITISHTAGDCRDDDKRNVTITAVLTGASTLPIHATMTGPCGSVNQSGTGSVTLTSSCALSPGTYTVTVTVAGCPSQTYTFTVAECCPKIVISHKVGDCNHDGTRPVIVTAVLTTGSSTINATMTGPCGSTSGTGSATVTLTESCNLNTGSYTVTVTVEGCPPQTYTFDIEDCCPKVDFEAIVKGVPICEAYPRPVIIKATVTPHTGVSTTATLIDIATNTVMATGTGSTPFVLVGSGNYGEGTHQVGVTFAAPLKCPPQYFQFCVPVCETLKCFNLRTLIVIALSTFFAIACMNGIAALAAYLSSAPWWLFGRYLDYLTLSSTLGMIMTAAIILAVLLLIWWRLCIKFWGIQIGACCWSCCIFRIILWQVPMIVGICLLWFLATCWLLNLVSALVLFLIAYLFFLWWRNNCCPGKCDALFYMLTALLAAGLVIGAIDYANVTSVAVNAPNALSAYIPWYVSLLWAATTIVRLIIGWTAIAWLIKWGICMSKD